MQKKSSTIHENVCLDMCKISTNSIRHVPLEFELTKRYLNKQENINHLKLQVMLSNMYVYDE